MFLSVGGGLSTWGKLLEMVVEEEAVAAGSSQSGLGSRRSGDGQREFREKKLKAQMTLSLTVFSACRNIPLWIHRRAELAIF